MSNGPFFQSRQFIRRDLSNVGEAKRSTSSVGEHSTFFINVHIHGVLGFWGLGFFSRSNNRAIHRIIDGNYRLDRNRSIKR